MIISATETRPSTSATSAPACQARLLPALIRWSTSVCTTALTTMMAMMIVPIATDGWTKPEPCHRPLEFSERR